MKMEERKFGIHPLCHSWPGSDRVHCHGSWIWRTGSSDEFNVLSVIVAIATMTAGSALLMWIGERITENGVGNGISIVLLINILSTIPDDMSTLYDQIPERKERASSSCDCCHHCGSYRCHGCILLSFFRTLREEFRFSIPRRCREEDGWRPVLKHSVEG